MGVSAFVIACSSLHTIDMSEDLLHQQIRAGEIITEGDRLQIVTADEKRYKIKIWVTSVDETLVHGKRSVEREEVSIPIDNIVTVKTLSSAIDDTRTPVSSVTSYFRPSPITLPAATVTPSAKTTVDPSVRWPSPLNSQ